MNFHVLTLFPEMVLRGLDTSIPGRALREGLISVEAVDIRAYSSDRHKRVDDYTYGGGAGMLMRAQPVYDAYRDVAARIGDSGKPRTVYVTPQGALFDQNMAEELAKEKDLVILCGHYEGVDERALQEIATDYLSIGDYVLTGGELPAMVMIDAVSRLIPGVLHNGASAEAESFFCSLLEYPQYTRPEEWRDRKVPSVLLGGNHKAIREWRLEQSEKRTRERRPDLYARYERLAACRDAMKKQKLLHIDMLELINRGQAELLWDGLPGDVLLRDKVSGAYLMTVQDEGTGITMLERVEADAARRRRTHFCVVSHQEFMNRHIRDRLGMRAFNTCFQAVYTRKEPLKVRTGREVEIRTLTAQYAGEVSAHYQLMDAGYVRGRIDAGCMWGAFAKGRLAGFAGIHEEGSSGMLEVLPEFRRQGIAMALEATIINSLLERGFTPYGQVECDNGPSIRLQEKLGHYFSREKVYWFEK